MRVDGEEFGYRYEIEWEKNIIVPTIYWCYGDIVTIGDVDYDVIIDYNDEKKPPYIILLDADNNSFNKILYLNDWEKEKRKEVTTFKITNNNEDYLSVKQINRVSKFNYFTKRDNITGVITKVYDYEYDHINSFFQSMSIQNKRLQTEWGISDTGQYLDIYVNDGLYLFNPNSYIEVTALEDEYVTLTSICDTDGKHYFEFYGYKYYVDDNFFKKIVTINKVDYEIYDSEKKTQDGDVIVNFILFETSPIEVKIENG